MKIFTSKSLLYSIHCCTVFITPLEYGSTVVDWLMLLLMMSLNLRTSRRPSNKNRYNHILNFNSSCVWNKCMVVNSTYVSALARVFEVSSVVLVCMTDSILITYSKQI